MQNEFELIKHKQINNLYAFIIELNYRQTHLHADIEVIYVLKGQLTVETLQQHFQVDEKNLLVLNSCQAHKLIAENSTTLLILQFTFKQFEQVFPQSTEIYFLTEAVDMTQSPQHLLLTRQIFELSQRYFSNESYSALLYHGYFSLMLDNLVKSVPYKMVSEQNQTRLLIQNERIRRIHQYIQQNHNKKILLSDIAKNEKLTVSYLSHFFKQHFGLNFQEYITMIRCEEAYYLLLNTTYNFLTIREICGFSDSKYLNRSIKKKYGLSPKELRQYNQKSEKAHKPLITHNQIDQQALYPKDTSFKFLTKLLSENES